MTVIIAPNVPGSIDIAAFLTSRSPRNDDVSADPVSVTGSTAYPRPLNDRPHEGGEPIESIAVWGKVVNAYRLRHRAIWGSLALLVGALSGCAQVDRQPQPSPRRAATPARHKQPTPVRTVEPTRHVEPAPKPVEATDDHRDRHPSMWKRKLRATYT
ncbi:MAG TPA: hypothetical protein VJZ71_14400 [Phycisphaerae bacterium]|nr:hypothetical protein [Phycisphaerae bacterium]